MARVIGRRTVNVKAAKNRRFFFDIHEILSNGRRGKVLLSGKVDAINRRQAQLIILEKSKSLRTPLKQQITSIVEGV